MGFLCALTLLDFIGLFYETIRTVFCSYIKHFTYGCHLLRIYNILEVIFMKKIEKVIVSAYTGVLMCKFSDMHEYAEKILKRPIYTHEFATEELAKELKEASKADFIAICAK